MDFTSNQNYEAMSLEGVLVKEENLTEDLCVDLEVTDEATELYAEHEIKQDLVIGPTSLQSADSTTVAIASPDHHVDNKQFISKEKLACHIKVRNKKKIASIQDIKERSLPRRGSRGLLRNRIKKTAYMKYKAEDMQLALQSVQNGKITAYRAAKLYKIPYQTLWDRINNVHSDRHGHATVLTKEEEDSIVKWIHHMSDIGFTVTKEQLLYSVASMVKELRKPNNFKDGVPGRAWFEAFLKRHPDIRSRIYEPLTSVRVTATKGKIRRWFKTVYEFFEKENCLDILKDPSRIFNCDESAFFVCPKGEAVLAKKGEKSVYSRTGNKEKENLTLSLGASADGKLMPVLALFPSKRTSRNILEKYPKSWAFSKSHNGWMTCETFHEYVANSFNVFLVKENIQKPVALFLDGHVSHLSLPLTNFCKDNGIILVALLPNATHDLKPMDVAVQSLKNLWSKSVYDGRMRNNGQKLQREDFGPILDKCIQQTLRADIIVDGFKATGLFPFCKNAINYALSNPTSSSGSNETFLTEFQKRLEAEKLSQFQNCDGIWQGDIRDENLYYFWRDITDCSDETFKNGIQIKKKILKAEFRKTGKEKAKIKKSKGAKKSQKERISNKKRRIS